MTTNPSQLFNKKNFVYHPITFILFVLYFFFVVYSYLNTFSGQLSSGFFVYVLCFIPAIFIPSIFIYILKKWNKFYVSYLILSVFYILTFLLFVVTIATHQKFRFFDPFLQINPKLSTELFTPKAAGEIRILLLGGSTTHNSNLPENKRYDYLLQQKLSEKYPNKKISVFNAGMDWFTSRHSLIAYVNYYQYYHADLVLIMHTINDVVRSFTPLDFAQNYFKYDYSHFYGPAAYAAFPERTLPEKIINKCKDFINKIILRKKDSFIDYDTSYYQSAKSYKYFLQAIINNVKVNNSKPIIVSEASIYNDLLTEKEKSNLWFAEAFCYNQADNNYNRVGRNIASIKSLENAMRYFNNIANHISADNHIPFIDLAFSIPKTSDYFIDDVHFTEKGADLVAGLVTAFIVENYYF